jgi:hypothetical protein
MLGELFWFGLVAILWGVGIWVAGAFVAAWVAGEKGRDPVAWFVIGLFLSAPVALLALVAVPDMEKARVASSAGASAGRSRHAVLQAGGV